MLRDPEFDGQLRILTEARQDRGALPVAGRRNPVSGREQGGRIAQGVANQGPVVVGEDILWVETDRLGEVRDGLLQFTFLPMGSAAGAVSQRVFGVEPDGLVAHAR